MIKMMNLFLILLFVTVSADAKSENASPKSWSKSKVSSFMQICKKLNGTAKNKERICACEALNFKWLLPEKNWNDFKKIYTNTGKKNMDLPDELQPISTLIYEVTTSCNKKSKYIAPKVRTLMTQ